ncbi:MAG: NRDE family protein [Bacteroidota bacterium]
MCTVTYLPTGTDQFLFTSNRDESPLRRASNVQHIAGIGKQLLYPQDSLAKGTWIAISDHNQLVCILNGAFTRHHHSPPYRLSRGIMALEFFDYDNATAFRQNFEFQGMEPFTMVIYDKGQLFDLRWDEQQVHFQQLAVDEPHLWSSPTLYDPHWQEKRQQWFRDWRVRQQKYTSSSVLQFHQTAGEGNPEYDLVMNRANIVRTTSITHITKKLDRAKLRYQTILTQKVSEHELHLHATA